eukprot:5140771-Heterocapsa_arctica.AAC.1
MAELRRDGGVVVERGIIHARVDRHGLRNWDGLRIGFLFRRLLLVIGRGQAAFLLALFLALFALGAV